MGKTFNFSGMVGNHDTLNNKGVDLFSDFANSTSYPVHDIPSNLLDIIDDQPFREYDEDNLDELQESIKETGLLSPLVVNKKGDRYEILVGRNRFRACQLLGWEKVPCKVLEVDETTANLILVDSNLNQRQELLPSELAFAYQIKIESLCKINGKSFTQTVEELANSENVSKRNIQRYLKLAKLSKELIPFVDQGVINFTAGVALVDCIFQDVLADYLSENEKKINDKTAASLLELQEYGNVTFTTLNDFFNKKPVKERKNIRVNFDRLSEILPESSTMTDEQLEDFIINALDYYKQNHIDEE